MRWQNVATGPFAGNWLSEPFLDMADPYLLWLDVSGLSGTSLAVGRTPVIPTLRQLKDAELCFKTDAIRPIALRHADDYPGNDSLLALADPKHRGATERFEVAAGFISDGGTPGAPAARTLPLPKSPGRQNRRSRTADRLNPKPLIGFIDYGCAFAHRQFRRPSLAGFSTRVMAIWDQGHRTEQAAPMPAGMQALQWGFPTDFLYGAETHRDRSWGHADTLPLDAYMRQFVHQGQLDEAAVYQHCRYPAIQNRRASHGTHVMDLATGWPSPLRNLSGMADSQRHDSDIVFVQLPRMVNRREISGLLRGNIYDGMRYILSCALPKQDVVINLSYGGHAGPHDGSSVLEQAIDWQLKKARKKRQANVSLVLPAGNSRLDRMHATAEVAGGEAVTFQWHNAPDDPSESFVEIWLPLAGDFTVKVTPPAGQQASAALTAGQAGTWVHDDNGVVAALVFAKAVCQSNSGRMVLLAVAKTRLSKQSASAPYGRWTVEVTAAAGTASAQVHAWCERDIASFGSPGVPRQGFFSPTRTSRVDTDGTLNSIAHGTEPVVVGGLVLGRGAAEYSSTGPGRGQAGPQRHRHPPSQPAGNAVRGPQLLAASDESAGAPGLMAAAIYGSDKLRLAGTSMSAAVVTRQIIETGRVPAGPIPRPHPPRIPQHPDDDLANP
jgi:hypothetical protein